MIRWFIVFLGRPADGNIEAVLTGECDLVDDTVHLEEQLEPIIELSRVDKVSYSIGQGPEWEAVYFGIKPASYDDGYNPFADERPDYFSDSKVRTAFAFCMDRPWAVTDILIDEIRSTSQFFATYSSSLYARADPAGFRSRSGKPVARRSGLERFGWQS